MAEVAARFSLDAMPGKQMSIDSDMRAGMIDWTRHGPAAASWKRNPSFTGAMDGAMNS